MREISDTHYAFLCKELCRSVKAWDVHFDLVVGVSRGGLIPAVYLSHALDIPLEVYDPHCIDDCDLVLPEGTKALIVDDIFDTFSTMVSVLDRFSFSIQRENLFIASLVSHLTLEQIDKIHPSTNTTFAEQTNGEWIKFPYETTYPEEDSTSEAS